MFQIEKWNLRQKIPETLQQLEGMLKEYEKAATSENIRLIGEIQKINKKYRAERTVTKEQLTKKLREVQQPQINKVIEQIKKLNTDFQSDKDSSLEELEKELSNLKIKKINEKKMSTLEKQKKKILKKINEIRKLFSDLEEENGDDKNVKELNELLENDEKKYSEVVSIIRDIRKIENDYKAETSNTKDVLEKKLNELKKLQETKTILVTINKIADVFKLDNFSKIEWDSRVAGDKERVAKEYMTDTEKINELERLKSIINEKNLNELLQLVIDVRKYEPNFTGDENTKKEMLQKKIKKFEEESTKEWITNRFQPDKDMLRDFPLNIDETIDYMEYVKENDKNSILSLGIEHENNFTIVDPGPNEYFTMVNISTRKKGKNTLGGWSKVINDSQKYRYGKRPLIVTKRNGALYVGIVKPDGQTEPEQPKVTVVESEETDGGILNTLKYAPNDAQNVTIHAVGKDVLISHAPGKGKTFTAILRAEKARNEALQNLLNDFTDYIYDPSCEPNHIIKDSDKIEIPRILIVGPKAAIVSQWQDEVLNNQFDPRHYVFQTNAFFRKSFTTGGYPKWNTLDDVSKKMITSTCWKSSEGEQEVKVDGKIEKRKILLWTWEGEDDNEDVKNYLDQIIPDAHKNFMPVLPEKEYKRSKIRDILKPKGKKRRSKYVTDSITNMNLQMGGVRNNEGMLTWGEYKMMDKWKMDDDEKAVWDILEDRPDLMQLYQEDIFIYFVPNKKYKNMKWEEIPKKVKEEMEKNGELEEYEELVKDKPYHKWKSAQRANFLGYLFGTDDDDDDDENDKKKKKLTRKQKYELQAEKMEETERTIFELEKMNEYAGFFWFFTNLKLGPYLTRKFNENANIEDTQGDTAFTLDGYEGSVPFEQRIYKAEVTPDTPTLEANEAYDPERFLQFLAGDVFNYSENSEIKLGMKPKKNDLYRRSKQRGGLRITSSAKVKVEKNAFFVEFDLNIPEDIQKQAVESLNTLKKNKTTNEDENIISIFDSIRDFKTKYLNDTSDDYVKANVIDKFVETRHGKELSQHRYQVEPGCIFVLDEAHEPTSITDNLNKISTKIIFELAAKSYANIFVTATPMQSENPQQQLWNFSQIFYRDPETGEGRGYQDIQNELQLEKERVRAVVEARKKLTLVYNIMGKITDDRDRKRKADYWRNKSLADLEKKKKEVDEKWKELSKEERKKESSSNKQVKSIRASFKSAIEQTKSEKSRKTRRQTKYDSHFSIVSGLRKVISRSFELQPSERKMFLNSVLDNNKDDYKILECFNRILKLYLWKDPGPEDTTLEHLDNLDNAVKMEILRNMGKELLKTRPGDFKNAFPAKMSLLTRYDPGRIQVEMDNLRKNICTYAKKRQKGVKASDDKYNKRFINYDFTSEKASSRLKPKKMYESYGFSDEDENDQIKNFDEKLSVEMFDVCQRRIIPIVVNRSTHFKAADKDAEVDKLIMQRLQAWAYFTKFYKDDNKNKTPVFILPLLANSKEEAESLLDKVLLKKWEKGKGCVTAGRETGIYQKKVPKIIFNYYEQCIDRIEECWGNEVTKIKINEQIETVKKEIEKLTPRRSRRIQAKDTEKDNEKKKELEKELQNLQKIFSIREKYRKVNSIEKSYYTENRIIVSPKDDERNNWKDKKKNRDIVKASRFSYGEWINIHKDYNLRWLPYECQLNKNERIMPFIPNLMSSKYREIANFILKMDKQHTNGIIYHKTYQVHYHLGRTLEAFGAKFIEPKNAKDMLDDLIENAKTKILKKWAQYQPPKNEKPLTKDEEEGKIKEDRWSYAFHLHKNQQEGRSEGKNVLWDPFYEIQRLKNWGYYVNKDLFDKEQKKDEAERDINIKENWTYRGKIYTDNFKSRHYMRLVQEDVSRSVLNKLHVAIRKLGEEVEEEWFNGDEHIRKTVKFVKIMRKSKNEASDLKLDQILRLKKPITITKYGVYELDDMDFVNLLDDAQSKKWFDGVLHEGRNSKDKQQGGFSRNYTGKYVLPATEADYIQYVSNDKYKGIGGATYYWQSNYASSTEFTPSLGKAKLVENVRRLLQFSIESCHLEEFDGEELDKAIDLQKNILSLVNKSVELTIEEDIDDKDTVVNTYKNVLKELDTLQKKKFEEFYQQINEFAFDFIILNSVVNVILYVENKKYKERQFSTKVYPQIKEALKPYRTKIEKLIKDLKNSWIPEVNEYFPDGFAGTGQDFMKQFAVYKYGEEEKTSIYGKYNTENRGKKNKLKFDEFFKQRQEKAFEKVKSIEMKTFSKYITKKMELYDEKMKQKTDNGYRRDRYISPTDIDDLNTLSEDFVTNETKENARNKATQTKRLENTQAYRSAYIKSIIDDKKGEANEDRKKDTRDFSEEPSLQKLQTIMKKSSQFMAKTNTWQLQKVKREGPTYDIQLKGTGEIKEGLTEDKLKIRAKGRTVGTLVKYDGKDGKIVGINPEITEDVTVELTTKLYRRDPALENIIKGNSNEPYITSSEKQGTEYSDFQPFQNAPNFGLGYWYALPLTTKNIKKLGDLQMNKTNEGRLGLRLQTVPKNLSMEATQALIYERMLALNNDTFLSFSKYTGGASSRDRDFVKQMHESGLIDYILMTDSGTTGVDFQSTRRSLMIMVQPMRSPGAKDQFIGRLVRNASHGIIPKLFQRVEFVTFFNSVKKATKDGEGSIQIFSYPYLTTEDWKRYRENYLKALTDWVDKRNNNQSPDDEDNDGGEDVNDFIVSDNEDSDADTSSSDNDDGDADYVQPGEQKASTSNVNASDIEDEYSSEEEAALPIDDVLEGNMLYVKKSKRKNAGNRKQNNDEVTGSDVDDLDLGEETEAQKKKDAAAEEREAEKERKDKSVEENDFDEQEEEDIEEDKEEMKKETEKFRKTVKNAVKTAIGRKKKRIVKFFQPKERAYWINIKLQLESNKNLVTPLDEKSLPIYENGIAEVATAIPKLQSDWDQQYEKAKRKFGTGKKEDLPPVDEPGEDDDDVDFDSKEISDAEDDDVTSSGVGGKLDKNVDYHIDNHVNISHVLLVGKWTELVAETWRGNHVFATVKEFLDHDFRTCWNTTTSKNMVIEDDIVVLNNEDGKTYRVEEKETIRNVTVPQYEPFGVSCYVCHRENDFNLDNNEFRCKFCGTDLQNTRYYKMQKPYLRVKRTIVKDKNDKSKKYYTEHATLPTAIYPEERTGRKSSDKNDKDRWTKDKNIIWNYRNGFEANIAERDRLRFYYSMVTVEHYFKQQKDQVIEFPYEVKIKNMNTSGKIYIRRQVEEPYGMNLRTKKWNELVWPQTKNNWATPLKKCEGAVEEESDVEFEYLSDIESEYSD